MLISTGYAQPSFGGEALAASSRELEVPSEAVGYPINIGVDIRRMGNPGIGRYMSSLFPEMLRLGLPDTYVFISAQGMSPPALQSAHSRIVTTTVPYYSIREQLWLPVVLSRLKCDLFHSPHFVLPLIRPCKSVVTIHDVIYLKYGREIGLVGRVYYSLAIRLAARSADRVITDSQFSKEEIVRSLGTHPDRITVIPLAPMPKFRPVLDRNRLEAVRRTHQLPENFFLSVGMERPRKNFPRIVAALDRLSRREVHLVLAGGRNPRALETQQAVDRFGLRERIHVLENVSDIDLAALYTMCRALVFPSLYEGFGLPVVEAMACGAPVITSDAAALPEAAGGAAILVDPMSVEGIASAMERVLEEPNLGQGMRSAGMARAAQLTWRGSAEATYAVYREVLAGT